MNNVIKSILKTAVYFLDQTDRFAGDIRDRFSDTVDRTSDRVSDLRDQAQELYEGEGHTMRNVLTFAAGVAGFVGAGSWVGPGGRGGNSGSNRGNGSDNTAPRPG